MATTNEEAVNQLLVQTDTSVRVAGAWLAIGSLLMVVSFAFHPPPAPNTGEQMALIADGATRWSTVHWAAAVGLSLFAMVGLVILAARSRLTASGWTMTAWAVLTLGALWTMTTAVAEATVVTQAAVAGNAATFEAWEAFAEGKASGFGFLALAVAVIAANEARAAENLTPAWAAWIATVTGVLAFVGMALGLWLGIGPAGVVWVAASILTGLWTLWFGVGLMRPEAVEPVESGEAAV